MEQSLIIIRRIASILILPFSAWIVTNESIISKSFDQHIYIATVIILITCFNESMASMRWQILLLLGHTKTFASRQGFFLPAKLLLALIGGEVFNLPGAISGYAVMTILQNVWLRKELSLKGFRQELMQTIPLTQALKLLKQGFSLYFTNSLSALVFLPLLATVAVDSGLANVGYLRVGQLLVQAFTLIPAAILPILFIKIRQNSASNEVINTEPSLRLIWCIGLSSLLVYLSIDEKIIDIFFGAGYEETIQPTRILILSAVLDSANQVLHSPHLAQKRIVLYFIAQNGAAILAALTGFILIPTMGLKGYLLAKIVFSWVPIIIYSIEAWEKFSSKRLLPLMIIASLLLTWLCWSSNTRSLVQEVSYGIIICIIAIEIWPLKKVIYKSIKQE
jgi:O-antigen/teichoic acid export membrane protein